MSPQEFTDAIAPKFVEAWKRLNIANDDFIRTTEPRHKAAVAELLQRCYDAGDIELDVFTAASTACRARSTTPTTSCSQRGNSARSTNGPSSTSRRRTTSSASPASRTACSTGTRSTRRRSSPSTAATRRSASSAAGCATSRSAARRMQWGIPLPWDPEHVTYVWFDALTNYLAAVGSASATGTDDGDYEDWWPVDYHLIGKDIIRHHCVYWPAMLMSAGIEPPKGWAIGGWLLVGGEKMSKTGGNAVNPLDLIDDVGVDGFRYYVLAETPTATTATSPSRAWSPATTPTSPTTSATCSPVWRPSSARSATASARGPIRRARSRRSPPRPTPTPSPAGTSSSRAAPSTPRGS